MALNIVGTKGDKNDPAFRYKMSSIVGKIEGRGNGIKTVIVNCADVAAQLHRPTEQLCKFFGCELGAQSRWVEQDQKAIVTGAHPTAELQRLVDVFCDKFVLCPSCNLPETTLKIKSKRGEIWHVCAACGAKEMADMSHKLCTFILKNAKASKRKKEDKKAKKAKEKKKKETPEEREKRKKREKKEKKRKKKEAAEAAAAANTATNQDEHGVVWSTDFSDDAVRLRRLAEMSRREKSAKAEEGAEEEEEEEEEKTREEVIEEAAARVAAAVQEGRSIGDVKTMAINLQVAGCLSATDRILIFYNAVMLSCRTPQAFVAAVEQNSATFEALVASLSTGPQGLLKAIETHFADANYRGLAPAVAVVLQAFYEADLLSEEQILGWHEQKVDGGAAMKSRGEPEETEAADLEGVALVKDKAKPFITWLKEAESDSEDSEDADE
jgi:translation initiation factor 5